MSSDKNIEATPCNENSCDVTAFQEIDVCVPINLEPYVDLGEPIIDCIEEPYLIPIPCDSWDKKKRKCRFTICQKLSIMIPIEFYVYACSGPASVDCTGEEECYYHDECLPLTCCGKEEPPPFVCCVKEEVKYEDPDFYYYVKGRRGRLRN